MSTWNGLKSNRLVSLWFVFTGAILYLAGIKLTWIPLSTRITRNYSKLYAQLEFVVFWDIISTLLRKMWVKIIDQCSQSCRLPMFSLLINVWSYLMVYVMWQVVDGLPTWDPARQWGGEACPLAWLRLSSCPRLSSQLRSNLCPRSSSCPRSSCCPSLVPASETAARNEIQIWENRKALDCDTKAWCHHQAGHRGCALH